MAMRDEMEGVGTWLFRSRSYLPIPVLLLLLITLRDPVLHGNVRGVHVWDVVSLLVGLAGLAVRCLSLGYAADGTSSRRTRDLVTGGLNTTGMYSVVRHPLYLGNYLLWMGPTLFCRSLPLAVIVTLVFWLYYERIMLAEEQQLRSQFGESFEQWAKNTPAFVPRLSQWRAPNSSFHAHKVVLSESTSLLALMTVLLCFELLVNLAFTGSVIVGEWWLYPSAVTIAIALYARIYKMLRRRANRLAALAAVLTQEQLS